MASVVKRETQAPKTITERMQEVKICTGDLAHYDNDFALYDQARPPRFRNLGLIHKVITRETSQRLDCADAELSLRREAAEKKANAVLYAGWRHRENRQGNAELEVWGLAVRLPPDFNGANADDPFYKLVLRMNTKHYEPRVRVSTGGDPIPSIKKLT